MNKLTLSQATVSDKAEWIEIQTLHKQFKPCYRGSEKLNYIVPSNY